MEERHVPEVFSFYFAEMNNKRLQPQKLVDWCGDPERMPFVAITKESRKEKVVGFARIQCLSDEKEAFDENDAAWYDVTIDWPEGKLGLFAGSLVLSEYRGQGIATTFTQIRLDYLESFGATSVSAASWAHDHGHTSVPVLERCGFRAVAETTGWANDENAETLCRWCLPEKCHCRTVLYVRSLGNHPDPVVKPRKNK